MVTMNNPNMWQNDEFVSRENKTKYSASCLQKYPASRCPFSVVFAELTGAPINSGNTTEKRPLLAGYHRKESNEKKT